MPLQPGTTLGPYEIQAPLGAGGMGEVYKARDTRLDRTVAIKVLPEHVASDPDLKQRFEREAKTISSLNHPHICTLYDIGSQDGIDFLVMEYLEGETLAQRLAKGALPLDQALRVAIEIADALDKAHRQGITHRDLKPGNIMLTKSGAKLLDFGLAKLKPSHNAPVGVSAPTVSAGLTGEGAILGTLQYMAPEQLEGQDADARTDIFAFGAVIYEMVTGRRAFEGKSQASLIAAILEHDPPAMSTLQAMSPPPLGRVVKKCLAKDPEARWYSAHDLHDELRWIAETGPGMTATAAASASHPARQWSLGWLVAVAAVAASLGGLTVAGLSNRGEQPPQLTTSFPVMLSDDVQLFFGGRRQLAISPDGRTVAFSGFSNDGILRLYQRGMSDLEATPILDTAGAQTPFFSPDGEWVGFLADGELRRVALDGRSASHVADVPPRDLFGATWGPDDTIYFGTRRTGLWMVPAAGGAPAVLTTLDANAGEQGHMFPVVVPGADAIVFMVYSGSPETLRLEAVSLATGERYSVVDGAAPAYFASGHLVYSPVDRSTELWAAPFDVERLALNGDPRQLRQGVNRHGASSANPGVTSFAVGSDGTLVYVPDTGGLRTLVWVDRDGREERFDAEARPYRSLRVSPDGQRAAIAVAGPNDDTAGADVYMYDLVSGTPPRFTFAPGRDGFPIWSASGDRVVFSSQRAGNPLNLYWKAVDGTGEVERLTTSDSNQFGTSWTPDGDRLVFVQADPETIMDIALVSVDGTQREETLLQTEYREWYPDLSLDGRWMAYASDESGQSEVYVRPFPDTGQGQWTISLDGGGFPLWGPNSDELFFRRFPDVAMMVVPIDTDPLFSRGRPTVLFDAPSYLMAGPGARAFDIRLYPSFPKGVST